MTNRHVAALAGPRWIFVLALLGLPVRLSVGGPIEIASIERTVPVEFGREVLPFLRKNCVSCHHGKEAESGVVLDSAEGIRRGGDSGPLVVPGKSGESLLLKVASHRGDSVMPPADNKTGARPLSPQELGLLKLWIDQGAAGGSKPADEIVRRPLAASLRPILALALSPDDELLACNRGARLFVYDLRGPRLAAEAFDPSLGADGTAGAADVDVVRSLAFDRTGNWLASGGYRAVRIWQRPRSELVTSIDGGLPLTAFALSADGARIALGSDRGVIELRRGNGEGEVVALTGHEGAVTAVAFSSDGAWVVSAGIDKSLRVWSAADGRAIGRWGSGVEVRSLAALAGPERVASGDSEGTIRVWPLAGLRESAGNDALPAPAIEMKGEGRAVVLLAGAKDRLVSASADGRIRLWDAADGKSIRELNHESPVAAVAIRPDGERIVSAGANGARLWGASDGRVIASIRGDYRPAREAVRADGAAFHAKELVAYRKRDVQEAEEALKREMGVVEGANKAKEAAEKAVAEKMEAAAKAIEARTLAEQKAGEAAAAARAAGEKKTAAEAAVVEAGQAVRKAEAALDAARAAADKDQGNADLAAAAVKGEQELATAKEAKKTADAALVQATEAARAAERSSQEAARAFSDAKSKAERPERDLKEAQNALLGASNFIATAAAILEKAQGAVPAAKETLAAAERLAAEREARKQELSAAANAATAAFRATAFSADGKLLAVGGDGALLLLDGDKGSPVEAIDESPAGWVRFGERRLVVATAEGKVAVRSAGTRWELRRTIGGEGDATLVDRVLSVDFSPDGSVLATAGGVAAASGELKLWSTADGSLVREIANSHGDTIQCVRFSPDGELLATASADRLVKVFRVATGELVQTLSGHGQHVLGVAWPKDGTTLASCGSDQVIKLWDLSSGTASRTLRGTAYRIGEYRRAVTSVAFVGETEHFVASSGDRTVRLHRTTNEYDVRAFKDERAFFHAAAATSDGKLVFGGGQDGVLHAWHGESGYRAWSFTADTPDEAIRPK